MYLITATTKNIEEEEDTNLQELRDEQEQLETLVIDKFEDLYHELDQTISSLSSQDQLDQARGKNNFNRKLSVNNWWLKYYNQSSLQN